MRRVLCLLLPLLFAAESALAETPSLLLRRQVTPAELWVYDADDCDEAGAIECASITLQCVSTSSLTVKVYGLYREEIEKWSGAGGKLAVAGIPGLGALDLDAASISDNEGLWSVSFRAGYSQPKILDDKAFGQNLSFELIYGTVAVLLDDDARTILRAFLAGCGDGPPKSG